MGKKRNKQRKHRYHYPRKSFVPLYWITVGITFILIWILPIYRLGIYIDYVGGMVLGIVLWTPFMVGAILFSNYVQRQGYRKCPNCGKFAYKGKTYCEKCGARVFWACPKCGTNGRRGLEFCKECGQNLKVVTFARQLELEGEVKQSKEESVPKSSNVIVTGSVVQFCPSCGTEINEDLTHCSICGSKFDR